jgi:hypothetical protein
MLSNDDTVSAFDSSNQGTLESGTANAAACMLAKQNIKNRAALIIGSLTPV